MEAAPPHPMRTLMTAGQVAAVLRVTPNRVYELVRSGLLPVVRLGRQVRIDSLALDKWIATGGAELSQVREKNPK